MASTHRFMEPEDRFRGIHSGMLRDPFEHRWTFREISPEEMAKRPKEFIEE